MTNETPAVAEDAPLKKPSLLAAFIFLTENNAVMPFIYTIF